MLLHTITPTEQRLLGRAAVEGKLYVVAEGRRAGANVIGIAAGDAPGSRYVVYGEISVPRAVSFGGLTGIRFAFYFGRERPQNLLATNSPTIPIRAAG